MSAAGLDPCEVLWRSTALEELFALSHDNFCNLSCYSLTVAAKVPLQREHVRRAMQCLYRKLPNLRTCQKRADDGSLWTCQMKEEKLQLEFLDGSQNYEDVFFAQTVTQYDVSNGPMWRVTVLPSEGILDSKGEECENGYRIIFGLHHVMTDGHSSVRMCGYFIGLLNDIIDGYPIDEKTQLAEYKNDELSLPLFNEVKETLKTDHEKYKMFRKVLDHQAGLKSLLFTAFPPENDPSPKTLSVSREVSESTSKKFKTKAKSEGVTIHSAFSTVLHSVFVELLNESDAAQNEYSLGSLHDVNLRRYWNVPSDDTFGVHIGEHKTYIHATKYFFENFWQNARSFHTKFNNELKTKHCIMMEVLESEINPPSSTADSFYNNKTPANVYYTISNIGDITKFFERKNGTKYNSVEAVHLRRSTSVHSYSTLSTFCIQTMRGQLICNFDYNTRYISGSTAKKILDKTILIIEKLFE